MEHVYVLLQDGKLIGDRVYKYSVDAEKERDTLNERLVKVQKYLIEHKEKEDEVMEGLYANMWAETDWYSNWKEFRMKGLGIVDVDLLLPTHEVVVSQKELV